jgi:hypothetical protein
MLTNKKGDGGFMGTLSGVRLRTGKRSALSLARMETARLPHYAASSKAWIWAVACWSRRQSSSVMHLVEFDADVSPPRSVPLPIATQDAGLSFRPRHRLGARPAAESETSRGDSILARRNSNGEFEMVIDEMYEGLFRSHPEFRKVP